MVRCKIEGSQKFKVLMIEDDPVILSMYQRKLNMEGGYEVDLARDGAEGLYKALNNDPDLVLLDIMLPKADGFHILAEMRKNLKTRKTPVIVLTNLGQADDAKRALQLGANDYIVKINTPPSDVMKKVQVLLSTSKAELAIDHLLPPYRIKIEPIQADAPLFAHDFAPKGLFICVECENQIILELISDYAFPGPGHRFVAKIVCPKCRAVY